MRGKITYKFYKRYSNRKDALKMAAKMRKSTGLPSRVQSINKYNREKGYSL